MLSIEHITSQRRSEARKARREGKQPLVAEINGDNRVFKAPFMGGYIPKGWKVTAKYFVDNSGFGTEGEGALTAQEFLRNVRAGYGYGVYEAGEFQVWIREYYPVD